MGINPFHRAFNVQCCQPLVDLLDEPCPDGGLEVQRHLRHIQPIRPRSIRADQRVRPRELEMAQEGHRRYVAPRPPEMPKVNLGAHELV